LLLKRNKKKMFGQDRTPSPGKKKPWIRAPGTFLRRNCSFNAKPRIRSPLRLSKFNVFSIKPSPLNVLNSINGIEDKA
jgi:hypothetical protein